MNPTLPSRLEDSSETREEQEIVRAYHEGELRPVPLTRQQVESYRASARASRQRDQRVSVRLSSADLEEIEIRAREEGAPFETLITSILHRYLSGRLIARS